MNRRSAEAWGIAGLLAVLVALIGCVYAIYEAPFGQPVWLIILAVSVVGGFAGVLWLVVAMRNELDRLRKELDSCRRHGEVTRLMVVGNEQDTENLDDSA